MIDSTSIVPSAKAMGKKRAASNNAPASRPDDAVPDAQPQPTVDVPQKQGMQTRKRVLPARSRRGGPGVGGCDVDVMILETRKRRLENEPLIPPATKFILTTNHALVPAASGAADADDPALNTQAYTRYFDRPEVQAACRTQELIQTPEFTQLSDDALVGGRFRPRNSEEELVDTSDAAYEKRHRKYETFEKRQRLREKEKLKHEQYKLKERIEQLRAMDTSAFLALPAGNFSEPPGVPHELEHDVDDPALYDLPGAHVNGAAAYNEGERRRREMLEIAESLEERYRVLLPPDRKWQEKKERLEREKREKATASASVEPDTEEIVVEPSDPPDEDEVPDDSVSVSAPARQRRHKQDSDGESEVDLDLRDHEKSKKLKLRIPPRRTATPVIAPPDSPAPPPKKKPHHNATIKGTDMRGLHVRHAVRAPDGRFLSLEARKAAAAGQSISVPPRKKPRLSTVDLSASPTKSVKSVSSTDGGGRQKQQQCILLTAAMRNAATQNARKTHRHVTAFGVRVPPEIEEVRDYELPYWVTEDSDDEGEWEDGFQEYGVEEAEAHPDDPEHVAASDIGWDDDAGDVHDNPPESED